MGSALPKRQQQLLAKFVACFGSNNSDLNAPPPPTELHRIFCGARTRHHYTQIKENQFWCQSACNKSAKLRLRNPKQKVENGAYFEGDYAVQEYNARANGQRVPESARQSGGEQYHL